LPEALKMFETKQMDEGDDQNASGEIGQDQPGTSTFGAQEIVGVKKIIGSQREANLNKFKIEVQAPSKSNEIEQPATE
jgi:hypothetical protein